MRFCQSAPKPLSQLRKIPNEKLFVSEPEPRHFGNPPNTSSSNWSNENWLKSRFHFSFAEYRDPARSNFGALRVLNDDLVQPDRGFGEHPHRDMEICTYVVRGELTHQDSMGTRETLGRGSIQFMSAGAGVRHSEFNLSKDCDLRFIQMWIVPRRKGILPVYGSMSGDHVSDISGWRHVVGDRSSAECDAPVKIDQDANIFVSEFEGQQSFFLGDGRQAYIVCLEGDGVDVAGTGKENTTLHEHDALEAKGPVELIFQGQPGSHVLIVEVAKP